LRAQKVAIILTPAWKERLKSSGAKKHGGVEVPIFDFKGAIKILESKGLWKEVLEIIYSILTVDHSVIQNLFSQRGWTKEKYILKETTWRWDNYKDKVAVSIELSLIDAVHRDFLRAQLCHKKGELDAMIYITSTFKEPKFKNVERDLKIFKPVLTVPILLVGLPQFGRRTGSPSTRLTSLNATP
jgi:hypothetical protein